MAYRPDVTNHLIKYVNEHLILDRLQASDAIVPVWRADWIKIKRSIYYPQICAVYISRHDSGLPKRQLQLLVPAGVGPVGGGRLEDVALEGDLHEGPDLDLRPQHKHLVAYR